jgi:hypothetical protein
MEIDFLCIEYENYQFELCLPSQYAHMCTVWGYFNKLFHDSRHDLAHLAWKPWNFVHDRSFLSRDFQNICNSSSLLFFLTTRSHNMTQCEGFIFFDFFWISYTRFKMRSKWRTWTFLAKGWILQNYLWISDKTSTCELGNDFLKKIMGKLWCGSSSHFPDF